MKPKDYYKKVGLNIRAIRIKKGISQIDLAHACDMEKQSMRRIEMEGTNLTLGTLLKISEALEVDIRDFLK